jgi:putative endonuclease
LDWIACLIYGALVWKERRRAKPGSGPGQTRGPKGKKEHLKVGSRGETLVYWHLRQAGYVIIARNRRPRRRLGELDMIGWDGPVLAFIEVKTRSGEEAGPPQGTVGRRQQQRIVHSAREYMKRLTRKPQAYRFDIAGVLWDPVAGFKVQVVKDAFKA